jgi:hypothetical protein
LFTLGFFLQREFPENHNPVNYIDSLGLETQAVIWHPAGWGGSSFGHVSTIVDGVSYSFGPNGMDIRSAAEYLNQNIFRDGIGTKLKLSHL